LKESITSPNAPKALGPYSHAVMAGGFLFTSGQVALNPKTGELVGGGIEKQTEQVLSNLEAVLTAAGMTFSNVVKSTIFMTDLSDFDTVNSIYATRFSNAPPARSCVQVAALPIGADLEIELVAYK
jgi:2-iminobutanoate/2-iminopropanoate deaminase